MRAADATASDSIGTGHELLGGSGGVGSRTSEYWQNCGAGFPEDLRALAQRRACRQRDRLRTPGARRDRLQRPVLLRLYMTEHAPPAPRRDSGKVDLRTIARRAMVGRSLLPDFSDAAVAETAALAEAIAPLGESARSGRDMRDLLWASIDNDDSLDLDQLSVAEPQADGAVKIFVAIADVDALVKKGSAIDGHAHTNTTSVYTAAQIFPMLPEKLSTDLTSLGEGVDRSAIVVEIVVRPDGSIAGSDVLPGGRSQPREARVQLRRRVARRDVARPRARARRSRAR